jgi:hypothetical protein
MTWTFVKHERQNAANAAAKREGKRLVYDYFVLRDGEHVAWFIKMGRMYCLTDLFHETISQVHEKPGTGPHRFHREMFTAAEPAQFESVVRRAASLIPTLQQCQERKMQREAARDRRNAEIAADKLANPSLYL